MNRLALAFALLAPASLLSGGCATLSDAQKRRAAELTEAARPTALDCHRADACAEASSLHALGERAFAASRPGAPRHYVALLDEGQDALLARINLIRSARRSIDLQSFIYAEDDTGYFVMRELVRAARRGVRVRVLLDQLFSVENTRFMAALAGAHANFEVRLYNPLFGNARTGTLGLVAGTLLRFRALNQRMHSKQLLIDDAVAITGGRNYQDRYYDWDPTYNYRDRDLLVAGPAALAMRENFEAFWRHDRAVPAIHLSDVARQVLISGGPPKGAEQIGLERPVIKRRDRVDAMSAAASDAAQVQRRVADRAIAVGRVDFLADLPGKHDPEPGGPVDDASHGLRALIESAQRRVLLQTPYLVMSRPARKLFLAMRQRPQPPRVVISTNSLAATDAFPVYALSFKYKRTYLRVLGFEIYEFKPFPRDAPIDLAATGVLPKSATVRGTASKTGAGSATRAGRTTRAGRRASAERRGASRVSSESRWAIGSAGAGSGGALVPLESAGVRIGLHAKSLVIDRTVGIVGTHNFDPRSDRYNTESAVAVYDATFAGALAAQIERDMAPGNAWTIARRTRDWTPLLSDLNYNAGKLSEFLPLFDIWPFRYATSYEFRPGPGCPAPVSAHDPKFRDCYEPVGDFPEVALPFKSIYTRMVTAFGAGLAPIL